MNDTNQLNSPLIGVSSSEVKETGGDEDKNGLTANAYLNIIKLNTCFRDVRDEVNGWIVELAIKINNEEYCQEIGECLTRINSILSNFDRRIKSSIYGKKTEE